MFSPTPSHAPNSPSANGFFFTKSNTYFFGGRASPYSGTSTDTGFCFSSSDNSVVCVPIGHATQRGSFSNFILAGETQINVSGCSGRTWGSKSLSNMKTIWSVSYVNSLDEPVSEPTLLSVQSCRLLVISSYSTHVHTLGSISVFSYVCPLNIISMVIALHLSQYTCLFPIFEYYMYVNQDLDRSGLGNQIMRRVSPTAGVAHSQ